MEETQAQETTLLTQMSQMGQTLQRLSTDAISSESQRGEHARITAYLKARAIILHSAGAELERQRQLTIQCAHANVQQTMHDASLLVPGRRETTFT